MDLLGDDHLLLSRLIYTLGSLMYSCLNAPAATQIAKNLLEFLWVVRYHPQQSVRQSVLYACSMVLVATPSHSIVADLTAQATELKLWLTEVVNKDADEECQKRALQALFLLENCVKKVMLNRIYSMEI